MTGTDHFPHAKLEGDLGAKMPREICTHGMLDLLLEIRWHLPPSNDANGPPPMKKDLTPNIMFAKYLGDRWQQSPFEYLSKGFYLLVAHGRGVQVVIPLTGTSGLDVRYRRWPSAALGWNRRCIILAGVVGHVAGDDNVTVTTSGLILYRFIYSTRQTSMPEEY